MSELSYQYVQRPEYRIYQCYEEYNVLTCKRLTDSNVLPRLYPPYTEFRYVRSWIPPALDRWVLQYQSIPSHVHIEKQ